MAGANFRYKRVSAFRKLQQIKSRLETGSQEEKRPSGESCLSWRTPCDALARSSSAHLEKVTMKVTQVFNAPHQTGLTRARASLAFLWKNVRRLGLTLLFCLVNFSGTANLMAQTTAASAQPAPSPRVEETAPPPIEEAALVIQNRTITVFRSRFQGRSPKVRMEGAQRQFQQATNSPQSGTVSARTIPEGVLVSIGEESIFVLTPEDLDPVSEETMD